MGANQGDQHRMDLLTVLLPETGHLLGKEHEADGLMAATLTVGTRLAVSRDAGADTSRLAADALFALLTADAETAGIGSSLFRRGREKR